MAFESDFGFLYFPGPRASAYLKVLSDLHVIPSTIILMSNEKGRHQEAYSHQYEHLAPLTCEFDEFVSQYQVNVVETSATSINDEEIKYLLEQATETSWLFSGGGILKEALFTSNNRFLHVHPGILPEEKGSTCFYYTILKNGTVGASAFWLTPELDAGYPITYSQFNVNIMPDDCTDKMVDYWLDPYIRAQVLKKFLMKDYKSTPDFTKRIDKAARAYYVMHPILRVAAVQRLISSYDVESGTGVFEVNYE